MALIAEIKFQSQLLKPSDNLNLNSTQYLADAYFLKPQPLATALAYKKTVYRYNCQVNYTLFYKDKLCQNKQAEIAKDKNKLTKLSGLEV